MFLPTPDLPCEKVRPGHDSSNMHNSSTDIFQVASLLPRLPELLSKLALRFELINLETL